MTIQNDDLKEKRWSLQESARSDFGNGLFGVGSPIYRHLH